MTAPRSDGAFFAISRSFVKKTSFQRPIRIIARRGGFTTATMSDDNQGNATNTRLDQIAWESIHARPKMAMAEARGNRAVNYRELGERLKAGEPFELAWGNFLHAFYDFRDASFFTYPPPASLSPGWQAILAGAAEWLCQEFDLPAPNWLADQRYTLPSPWDPWGLSENLAADLAEVEEPFRRRNVLFTAHDLIAL